MTCGHLYGPSDKHSTHGRGERKEKRPTHPLTQLSQLLHSLILSHLCLTEGLEFLQLGSSSQGKPELTLDLCPRQSCPGAPVLVAGCLLCPKH